MYSFVLYYNIEKSSINAVSAYLLLYLSCPALLDILNQQDWDFFKWLSIFYVKFFNVAIP